MTPSEIEPVNFNKPPYYEIAGTIIGNMFMRYSTHLLHAAITCCSRLAARLKAQDCGPTPAKIMGSNLT
jgi:hypothetical protein